MTSTNTGPEERSDLAPSGGPRAPTKGPAAAPPGTPGPSPSAPSPAGPEGEAASVWKALLVSIDMLAGVVGVSDDARPVEVDDEDDEEDLDAFSDIHAYRKWVHDKAQLEPGPFVTDQTGSPTFSVIVPVFRPELWYLQRCVESVKAQTYGAWELCLCDDASGSVDITRYLQQAAADDHRIKVAVHDENQGISAASNTALALARGDYVALLDHDDELTPDSLARVAHHLRAEPDADVVYTDEDKYDQGGHPGFPQFKPDWSPDLLLSYPYLGHLTVVRRTLMRDIGGFRTEMDGSQDYDLMLRATERARRVTHIPRVLYHWRVVTGSAAGDPGAKPWAYDASRRALADALVRRELDAHVESGPFIGSYHTRRAVRRSPTVTIIVPFRDHAPMLRACVDSLGTDAGHEDFEIVLVDNDSVEPETEAVVDILLERPGTRLLEHPGPFNWSAVNNAAARTSDAEMLLFVNSDVVAKGGRWIAALIEQAQRPEVGATAARLLHPDGTVQHAGIVLGMHGLAGHLMEGRRGEHAGYMGWTGVVKECGALSGACMMTRRAVYEEIGGFDETFAFEFGDVDFCLRLRRAGYSVLFTPHAELVHHASHTKGTSGFYRDAQSFLRKWNDDIRRGDPFYNANLSRLDSNCVLRPVDEDRQWEKLLSGLASS